MKIIFSMSRDFIRTQQRTNPFFDPVIDVCKKKGLDWRVLVPCAKKEVGYESSHVIDGRCFDRCGVWFWRFAHLLCPWISVDKVYELFGRFYGKLTGKKYKADLIITIGGQFFEHLVGVNPGSRFAGLQHGVIYSKHEGYFYPDGRTRLRENFQSEMWLYGQGYADCFFKNPENHKWLDGRVKVIGDVVRAGEMKVEKVGGGGEGMKCKGSSVCRTGKSDRLACAEKKVDEWLAGVDDAAFDAALEKLVREKTAAGEYRFNKPEERELALEGARKFYREFSRKIVPLSDGRYVYFSPDERARIRNASNAVSWAEYAFHAVSNGGAKVKDKNYNERWYNPYKFPAFALIEAVLREERCFIRLSSADVRYHAIVFAGTPATSLRVQVVTRLDDVGNIDANLSEVAFTASSKEKKLPRFVPLTEAVRTVVHYQTTAGSYPPNDDNIAFSSDGSKGGGRLDHADCFFKNSENRKWLDGRVKVIGDVINAFKPESDSLPNFSKRKALVCMLQFNNSYPMNELLKMKDLWEQYLEENREMIEKYRLDVLIRHHPRFGNVVDFSDWTNRFTWAQVDKRTWSEVYDDALCCVGFNSTTVIEAAGRGIPVIILDGSPIGENSYFAETFVTDEFHYPSQNISLKEWIAYDEGKRETIAKTLMQWYQHFYTPFDKDVCLKLLKGAK